MGRRSQRSMKGSATMAARVAASLAPWTRKAGFIAKRSYLNHQAIVLLVAGLCAQAGAGAIGFDSKGDNLGIIMQFALPMRHPAPSNSLSPTPATLPPHTTA
ncbi:hypothetical protein QJQ45_027972, partial [Haematococcus lacustris]